VKVLRHRIGEDGGKGLAAVAAYRVKVSLAVDKQAAEKCRSHGLPDRKAGTSCACARLALWQGPSPLPKRQADLWHTGDQSPRPADHRHLVRSVCGDFWQNWKKAPYMPLKKKHMTPLL